MKYLTKTSLLAVAGLIAVLPIFLAAHLVSASGTATLYLSPASTTVAQGANFDIDIHEDSGSDTVNAVQANLNYSNNLSFVSITNSPDFNISAQSTGGGGTVTIARGANPAVSGDHVVATVRFTASGSGTGSVSFASSSAVVRSSDNGAEALTTTGGTYTVTPPTTTMSLSPATKTVSKGTSFDVAVYENSSTDSVNAVQANLSYPSSLLTFVSITPNTSVWPIEAENTGGSGLVKIGRGTTTPVTGSQLVATVRFTGASAGTAQVAFTSGSGIIRSSDNTAEPSTNTGGSYTITSTSTPPPSGGGGTTTGGTTKKTTTTTTLPKSYTTAPATGSTPVTTPADTSGPVISGIKVTNVTTKSATISWQTSEPATSEVDYGLNKDLILSTTDGTLASNHSLALDPKELVAHKTYTFVVKSTDASGNQSVSNDMTFKTGGLQITTIEIAAAAGVAVLGGGVWLAAAGGLKLGGGMAAASATGGIYIEPKPIIVGGGSPPPSPVPVILPQTAPPPTTSAATTKAAPPPAKPETATPGKVVGPKDAPAPQADNQTLPKWVKKK